MDRQLYRHFKGGVYEVLFDAIDAIGNEAVVVYRKLGDDKVWVRTASNFHSTRQSPGAIEPRFRLLSPTEALKAISDAIDQQGQKMPENGPEAAPEPG